MENIQAKSFLKCDECNNVIKIVEKGKSLNKEKEAAKKFEPIPLEAILPDPSNPGDTKSYHFCEVQCLSSFLLEKYPKSKKKSKASTGLDVEVVTFRRF
jgi:hypothetical protein